MTVPQTVPDDAKLVWQTPEPLQVFDSQVVFVPQLVPAERFEMIWAPSEPQVQA